jgi:HTH-type transcriptional regulator/antitoxin HipB
MPHTLVTPTQMGQILKTARKNNQLSQTELASRVGLSQSRISAFEQQPENISLGQLLSVLNALGLELTVQARQSTAPQALLARDSDAPEW